MGSFMHAKGDANVYADIPEQAKEPSYEHSCVHQQL